MSADCSIRRAGPADFNSERHGVVKAPPKVMSGAACRGGVDISELSAEGSEGLRIVPIPSWSRRITFDQDLIEVQWTLLLQLL